MKVYRFSLFTLDVTRLVMSTEVDEPDPKADLEFWNRFLEGDCYMEYLGEFEDEDINSDDRGFFETFREYTGEDPSSSTKFINFLEYCIKNNK